MKEPEVSLRIAMKYIQSDESYGNITVSIDGAHIKTNNTLHFDLVNFMHINGYEKSSKNDMHKNDMRWQGEYSLPGHSRKIVVSSKPGIGDVTICLKDGRTLYVESKKFKSGSGGEYPAMREAIGQLMTGCPDCNNLIPVVAVPYSTKSDELSRKWSCNQRIRTAGIRFMLVKNNGDIEFI